MANHSWFKINALYFKLSKLKTDDRIILASLEAYKRGKLKLSRRNFFNSWYQRTMNYLDLRYGNGENEIKDIVKKIISIS